MKIGTRRFWSRCGAVLIGTLIAFCIAEGVLVIAQVNTRSNTRFVAGKGVTYLPNAYYRHTKEGFSEGYFNSHGFRDYERTYSKPANTFRIVLLGDSYVEGLQLPLEKTFGALLEKRLNDSFPSKRFEVLNLGQSGSGTSDEYMRYLNFGAAYKPDLVILAFLTGNDIRNNSKSLNREAVSYYFTLDSNGNLVLDESAIQAYARSLTGWKRLFQFIARRSYVFSLVSERVFLLRQGSIEHNNTIAAEARRGGGSALNELSDLNVYARNPTDSWREAFTVTHALLRQFKRSVEEHGSRFILVTLANAEQVYPERQRRIYNDHGGELDLDLEQPDRMIAEFAAKEGITYLQLLPAFRESHHSTGRYLHGFFGWPEGHWNEEGHRLAAEKIFEFLQANEFVR